MTDEKIPVIKFGNNPILITKNKGGRPKKYQSQEEALEARKRQKQGSQTNLKQLKQPFAQLYKLPRDEAIVQLLYILYPNHSRDYLEQIVKLYLNPHLRKCL